MTQLQLAAIAAAGTAAVLAPIDPQALRDLLADFDAADAIPEYIEPAPVFDAHVVARVATALGLPRWTPTPAFGETATRVSRWSIHDLNDTYARFSGPVAARQVEVPLSDGSTFTTTEIAITIELPGVGRVEAFTYWDAEARHADLPVVRALTAALAA